MSTKVKAMKQIKMLKENRAIIREKDTSCKVVQIFSGDKNDIESLKYEVLAEYEWSFFRYKKFSVVKKKGKYGFIDDKGDILCPFEYDDIYLHNSSVAYGVFKALKKGKYGLITKEGKELCEFKYDSIGWINKGLINARIEDKWCFINFEGKQVCEPIYDKVGLSNGYYVEAVRDGRSYVINIEGKEVGNPPYEHIRSLKYYYKGKALFVVQRGKKYGIIDTKSKELCGVIYDFIDSSYYNGLVKAQLNGRIIYINKNGKVVIS